MRSRIQRAFRLEPELDDRIAKTVKASCGNISATDVVHKALTLYFKNLEGEPSLETLVDSLATLIRLLDVYVKTVSGMEERVLPAIESARLETARKLETLEERMRLTDSLLAQVHASVGQLIDGFNAAVAQRKGWLK